MDNTLNRGYPFPECEPPLVKDASDIIQLQQQALAIDADMAALEDRYLQVLIRPDACKMSSAATVSTEQTFFPFFNTAVFDNTGATMADTAAGLIQIRESGWYQVGEWGQLDSPDETNARVRFLRSGAAASNFSDSSFRSIGNASLTCSEVVLLLTAGDTISVEVRHGAVAGTNRTFTWNIYAVQLLRT